MKALYLPETSVTVSAASSHSNGWIELQDGQRWNPSHVYKFNGSARLSLVRRLLKLLGGVHAF
jgi:hypothetical protein